MASPEHIMWSDEKVLFFIDVYRAREVLWNPKNEDFYKQNLKKDAWSEIARLMSTSAEICRNKMTSILASFRREKAKEKNSMGTGKGTSDTYTSRWFAYEALKFLSDRNTPRKRKNTESLQQSATPNVPEQAGEFTPPAPASPPQAKRNRKAQNDVLSDVMGVLKSTAQKLETSAGISDVTKSFAFFIGGKMSMYSLQTRTAVEHAMFDIIMKADRGYYENGPIRFHPDNQDARQRNVPYSTLPSTSVGPPPGTYAAAPYDYTPADYSSNQTPYSVSPPSSFASSFNEFADLM